MDEIVILSDSDEEVSEQSSSSQFSALPVTTLHSIPSNYTQHVASQQTVSRQPLIRIIPQERLRAPVGPSEKEIPALSIKDILTRTSLQPSNPPFSNENPIFQSSNSLVASKESNPDGLPMVSSVFSLSPPKSKGKSKKVIQSGDYTPSPKVRNLVNKVANIKQQQAIAREMLPEEPVPEPIARKPKRRPGPKSKTYKAKIILDKQSLAQLPPELELVSTDSSEIQDSNRLANAPQPLQNISRPASRIGDRLPPSVSISRPKSSIGEPIQQSQQPRPKSRIGDRLPPSVTVSRSKSSLGEPLQPSQPSRPKSRMSDRLKSQTFVEPLPREQPKTRLARRPSMEIVEPRIEEPAPESTDSKLSRLICLVPGADMNCTTPEIVLPQAKSHILELRKTDSDIDRTIEDLFQQHLQLNSRYDNLLKCTQKLCEQPPIQQKRKPSDKFRSSSNLGCKSPIKETEMYSKDEITSEIGKILVKYNEALELLQVEAANDVCTSIDSVIDKEALTAYDSDDPEELFGVYDKYKIGYDVKLKAEDYCKWWDDLNGTKETSVVITSVMTLDAVDTIEDDVVFIDGPEFPEPIFQKNWTQDNNGNSELLSNVGLDLDKLAELCDKIGENPRVFAESVTNNDTKTNSEENNLSIETNQEGNEKLCKEAEDAAEKNLHPETEKSSEEIDSTSEKIQDNSDSIVKPAIEENVDKTENSKGQVEENAEPTELGAGGASVVDLCVKTQKESPARTYGKDESHNVTVQESPINLSITSKDCEEPFVPRVLDLRVTTPIVLNPNTRAIITDPKLGLPSFVKAKIVPQNLSVFSSPQIPGTPRKSLEPGSASDADVDSPVTERLKKQRKKRGKSRLMTLRKKVKVTKVIKEATPKELIPPAVLALKDVNNEEPNDKIAEEKEDKIGDQPTISDKETEHQDVVTEVSVPEKNPVVGSDQIKGKDQTEKPNESEIEEKIPPSKSDTSKNEEKSQTGAEEPQKVADGKRRVRKTRSGRIIEDNTDSTGSTELSTVPRKVGLRARGRRVRSIVSERIKKEEDTDESSSTNKLDGKIITGIVKKEKENSSDSEGGEPNKESKDLKHEETKVEVNMLPKVDAKVKKVCKKRRGKLVNGSVENTNDSSDESGFEGKRRKICQKATTEREKEKIKESTDESTVERKQKKACKKAKSKHVLKKEKSDESSDESEDETKQMKTSKKVKSKQVLEKEKSEESSGESVVDSKPIKTSKKVKSKQVLEKEKSEESSGESEVDSKQMKTSKKVISKQVLEKEKSEELSGKSEVDSKQMKTSKKVISKQVLEKEKSEELSGKREVDSKQKKITRKAKSEQVLEKEKNEESSGESEVESKQKKTRKKAKTKQVLEFKGNLSSESDVDCAISIPKEDEIIEIKSDEDDIELSSSNTIERQVKPSNYGSSIQPEPSKIKESKTISKGRKGKRFVSLANTKDSNFVGKDATTEVDYKLKDPFEFSDDGITENVKTKKKPGRKPKNPGVVKKKLPLKRVRRLKALRKTKLPAICLEDNSPPAICLEDNSPDDIPINVKTDKSQISEEKDAGTPELLKVGDDSLKDSVEEWRVEETESDGDSQVSSSKIICHSDQETEELSDTRKLELQLLHKKQFSPSVRKSIFQQRGSFDSSSEEDRFVIDLPNIDSDDSDTKQNPLPSFVAKQKTLEKSSPSHSGAKTAVEKKDLEVENTTVEGKSEEEKPKYVKEKDVHVTQSKSVPVQRGRLESLSESSSSLNVGMVSPDISKDTRIMSPEACRVPTTNSPDASPRGIRIVPDSPKEPTESVFSRMVSSVEQKSDDETKKTIPAARSHDNKSSPKNTLVKPIIKTTDPRKRLPESALPSEHVKKALRKSFSDHRPLNEPQGSGKCFDKDDTSNTSFESKPLVKKISLKAAVSFDESLNAKVPQKKPGKMSKNQVTDLVQATNQKSSNRSLILNRELTLQEIKDSDMSLADKKRLVAKLKMRREVGEQQQMSDSMSSEQRRLKTALKTLKFKRKSTDSKDESDVKAITEDTLTERKESDDLFAPVTQLSSQSTRGPGPSNPKPNSQMAINKPQVGQTPADQNLQDKRVPVNLSVIPRVSKIQETQRRVEGATFPKEATKPTTAPIVETPKRKEGAMLPKVTSKLKEGATPSKITPKLIQKRSQTPKPVDKVLKPTIETNKKVFQGGPKPIEGPPQSNRPFQQMQRFQQGGSSSSTGVKRPMDQRPRGIPGQFKNGDPRMKGEANRAQRLDSLDQDHPGNIQRDVPLKRSMMGRVSSTEGNSKFPRLDNQDCNPRNPNLNPGKGPRYCERPAKPMYDRPPGKMGLLQTPEKPMGMNPRKFVPNSGWPPGRRTSDDRHPPLGWSDQPSGSGRHYYNEEHGPGYNQPDFRNYQKERSVLKEQFPGRWHEAGHSPSHSTEMDPGPDNWCQNERTRINWNDSLPPSSDRYSSFNNGYNQWDYHGSTNQEQPPPLMSGCNPILDRLVGKKPF